MNKKISNAELKGIHAGVILVFEAVCHALHKPTIEFCGQTTSVVSTEFSAIGFGANTAYHPELVTADSSEVEAQQVTVIGWSG